MRVAVMGAGAVGCYYGGLLARAGHAVTLIGRAPHVEAIQRAGLRLETRTFDERVAAAASSEASAAAAAELVLCCVKSTDTEEAAAQLAPHLAPAAVVLSLQNGIDNAARLQAKLAQRVIPTVVYVGTEMAGPGHVRHHGRGELVLGAAPQSEHLAALLCAAAIPTTVNAEIDGELWAKLILNCAYNALSAITQLPYGVLRRSEGVEAVLRDITAECLAVASAAGVEVPGDPWEAVERIARTVPGQYSSTAQDLARGRLSEIDHLNGVVVRQGERLGVATPVNRVLHTLVKAIESKRR
ncbi:MAG TPA: ketopantoate reductase family protein [Myxococcota bacterium]|nr:ketopantoate reductase family protein [Myxococcota bacterium]